MARRLRAAAPVVCAGLVLFLQAAAPQSDRAAGSTPTPGVPAARAMSAAPESSSKVVELERRIDEAGSELDDVASWIPRIDGRIQALEEEVRASGRTLDLLRARLVRQTRVALDDVSAWAPADATTIDQLAVPLQAVAGALHALDGFRTAQVAGIADDARRSTGLAALRSEVAADRDRLDRALLDLETMLPQARLAAQGPGRASEEGSDLLRRAESLIGRASEVRLELGAREARLQGLSVELDAERIGSEGGMRFAGRIERTLFTQMSSAEGAISALVQSLLGEVPPVVEPVDPDGVLQVCPVDPPNAYSDDFGAPRYTGGYHPHQGNDLFAPEGTPIRAPFPGNAVDTSNTLGGNAVSVYGAAGYVYNAHLLAFGTLGPVEAGEIIGYVGNTGDAIHSPSHDHFEWHPDNGPAVDPYGYLNAVCRSPWI